MRAATNTRLAFGSRKPRALGATSVWLASDKHPALPETQRKTPQLSAAGFWGKTLAMTYSRMLDAHYHRRMCVSLPSSGWDRVVPHSYCHQGEGGGSQVSMHLVARTLSLGCFRQAGYRLALGE